MHNALSDTQSLAEIMVLLTVCGCFAMLILAAIGLAIWKPDRLPAIMGQARVGFLGFAGICATVMTMVIRNITQLHGGAK